MAKMAKMAFMAMADGSTNMAITDIQWKGIEKLAQMCCFLVPGYFVSI